MNLLQELSNRFSSRIKYSNEVNFWGDQIKQCLSWYRGDIRLLYGEPPPEINQKIHGSDELESALLTWWEIHQKRKYLQDLQLNRNSFRGIKILDIGSGPFPSALAFSNCEIYCLDPLWADYLRLGYPIHCYGNLKVVNAKAESIPFKDNFFDLVISVNAIDHVDNFNQVAKEIKRVLKPAGKIVMHIHYHESTPTEPVILNDSIVDGAFRWCKNWHKVTESKSKRGFKISRPLEVYTLWSNVHPVN